MYEAVFVCVPLSHTSESVGVSRDPCVTICYGWIKCGVRFVIIHCVHEAVSVCVTLSRTSESLRIPAWTRDKWVKLPLYPVESEDKRRHQCFNRKKNTRRNYDTTHGTGVARLPHSHFQTDITRHF